MNTIKLLFVGSMATTLLLAYPARAQEDEDSNGRVIEEIVVTAEKREESLQNVPISVSALSGDQIEAIGISTIEEFQFFVPGVTITNDAMAIVNIRGIGTSAFGVGTDPSSTVYIDGVYMPRPTTGYQDMFDVERIELLRGPQGVLYGRNSSGGSLNIFSRGASEEFEGKVGLTIGNLNKRLFSGTVSGPLSDNVRARATLLSNQRDGRYEDPNTGRQYQNQDTLAGRLSLEIDASDDVQIVLRADFNKERETGYPTVQNNITQDLIDAGATPTNGKDQLALDGDVRQNIDNWGTSATVTWNADNFTFRSITSYRSSEFDILIDVDSTDLFLRDVGFVENSDSFSQEFLFSSSSDSRLQWTVGAFYFWEDANDDLGLFFGPNLTIQLPGANVTNAYALFGQASYAITDRLTGSVGLRYSYETKDYQTTTIVNGNNFGTATPDENWNAFTPKFVLDYTVSDDVMLYASASKGFKSGGFQVGDPVPFNPEFLWAYEVGVKSILMDQRLRANFGAFYYDYTDLQVVTFVNGVGQTDNAGAATLKGFEAEFLGRLSDGLDLTLNIAYLDATYDTFAQVIGGVPVDLAGNTLPNTPKWTYSFGALYTYALGGAKNLTLRGDYAWRDSVNFKSSNLPRYAAGSYAVLNARIAIELLDKGWEFALYGTNLTDEDIPTYKTDGIDATGNSNPNNPLTVFGAPRQYGVKVTYNF